MNSLHRPLALLALLLSLGGPAGAVWTSGSTPTDFSATDWNGHAWSLYGQRGKVVLLNFGATW